MDTAATPAPLHAVVDCPHGEACGACSLLRRPYAQQLESKRQRLGDTLARQIRLQRRQLLPTLPSPRVEGYRNRAKLTISSDREHRWRLGYFKRNTREVVDAPDCQVLVPELLATTRELRALMNSRTRFPFTLRHVDLRCGSDPNQQHLTLVIKASEMAPLPIEAIADACPRVAGIGVNLNTSRGAQVIKGPIEPVLGVREVFVDTAGLSMRVSPGSFFQVNLDLLEPIHQRMSEFFGNGELLFDLYAGVGTHGLALRRQFDKVLCVEGVRSAVADAKATIKLGHVHNVEVIASPIHRAIRRLRSESPRAIVLNPSAAGADEPALQMVNDSSAKRLAYLSCDPETLARDLEMLVRGRFRIESVQPIDMMPQTGQIEALALLRR